MQRTLCLSSPCLLQCALLAALLAVSPTILAASSPDDGIYGRMSGDVGVQVDVGQSVLGGSPALHARAAARFLQTAGLYVGYLDDVGESSTRVSRAIILGAEFRPLFLPRMASNMEQGPAMLDLSIDSLSLRLGAFASQRQGFRPASAGLAIDLGLGFPLQRSAAGPWIDLSAGLLLSHDQMASTNDGVPVSKSVLLSVTLAWQAIVRSGLFKPGVSLVE